MWTISQMMCLGILVSLSVVDIYFRKIPMDILVLANLSVVAYQIVFQKSDIWLVVGGIGIGGLFLLISKITHESMGYGDGWAILILGIYLGIWGLLEVLAVAFFLLAIASVIYLSRGWMVKKRLSRKASLPFYPFLAAGYLLSLMAGGMKG